MKKIKIDPNDNETDMPSKFTLNGSQKGSHYRSKRKYPERPCANAHCDYGGNFIPHDRRQIYCSEQCRINFHNDNRHLESNSTFTHAKKLIEIDKKLSKIHKKYVNDKGYCAVMKEIFFHEDIDVMLLVQEKTNIQTKGKVKLYFRYGIELHPDNASYYIIHKIQNHD